nr:putative Ig domain-containing protein [Tychonema sp. BBK16]
MSVIFDATTINNYAFVLPSVSFPQNLNGANSAVWEILSGNFQVNDGKLGTNNDAFDNGVFGAINGSNFVPPATVDLTGSTLTAGPVVYSGLNVTAQHYADQTLSVLRTVYSFGNPTGADISIPFSFKGNLGSDSNTGVSASSSGDSIAGTNDSWVISSDGTDVDAVVTHVFAGPTGGSVTPSAVNLLNGNDNYFFNYNITIPANSTRSLLFFTGLSDTAVNASTNAAIFNSISALKASTLLNDFNGLTTGAFLNWSLLDLNLTSTAAATVNQPFSVTATFSENATGFDITDIIVGNGTVSNFVTVSGSEYTFNVTPTANGNVTVDVAKSVAIDTALSVYNNSPATLTRQYDQPPTVTLVSTAATTVKAPFTVNAVFNEDVTGFDITDITLGNGTASNFTAVNGKTYVFDVTPTADGSVTVDVAAAKATDTGGFSNTAATQLTRTADITAPTVALTPTSAATVTGLFSVTATFNENVTGFDATDITVANATVGNFATVDAKTYTFGVTPTTDGSVTVDIAAAKATDTAGNNNTAATQLTRTANVTAPTVTINQASSQDPTTNNLINYTVEFSEPVTGFDATKVALSGTAGATTAEVKGSGKSYNVAVSGMTQAGTVIASINANAVTDLAGKPNTASTSTDNQVTFSKNTAPVVASAINNQSATLNTAFNYTVPTGTFTDAQNDTLTYTATKEDGTALPTWLTFNATTRSFNGTPATANIGNLQVKVSASDGKAATSNTFLLTVSDKLNTAPVVASAINNQSATLNTAFTYTVPTTTFTDAQNDTLTYTATKEDGTALPTWLTFNATTRSFSGTPATANIGNLQVKVSASDGKAATSNTFLLTVSDKLNTAPVVASAISDTSATVDKAFTYSFPDTTFTDTEKDPLTYSATKEDGTPLPTWLKFDATTRSFNGTPATSDLGNVKVKVSASDGKASTGDVFVLTVNTPTPSVTPTPSGTPTPTVTPQPTPIPLVIPIPPVTPTPTPTPSVTPTPTPSVTPTPTPTAIAINTPPVGNIDRGERTNFPQNQVVDRQYLLTNNDDTSIPQSAFGQPIFGLSGNDNLTGSADNDTIYGNEGADTIDGGNGNDNLFGGKKSDQLSGGNGNDFLSGNNDNDTLTGGEGNDILRGGKENDVLIGGNGDDELWGDRGFDVLTGGAGKDTFVLQYTATNPSQADVITDFTSDDKIKLIGVTFSQLTFESVSVILDGATAVASTVIKSGNDYLGVLYNLNPTALNSSSFL